ncbi:MAG: PepSY domain-containing protein [Clostridia bacterium]|nr:PepSY domain-containing protein [Clostridia bacterium]
MKKLTAFLLAALVVLSLSVTAFAAPSDNLISKNEAKAIALKDAGYEANEVRFLKAKLDFDDGRYEYEIEFRAEGNLEYDYTINAENGKIVEFDRDYEGRDRFEFFNFFAFLRNLFENLFRKLA